MIRFVEEISNTNGHIKDGSMVPESPPTPHWRHHEPAYVHSLKWHDPESGIEHMTVVRADDVDDLWRRVKTITAMVKASRTRQQEHDDVPADAPRDGWCVLHNVAMKQQTNEKGKWFSHYDTTAQRWCHGKGATSRSE